MKVILLKSVPKLGKTNDVVEVSEGYANNALFTKKLAVPATAQALAARDRTEQNKITEKKIQHELLDKAIDNLEGKTLIYTAKANEKGSLFSKVTEQDVAKAMMDQYRLSIDAKLLTIKEGHIKQRGIYTVEVKEGNYISEFTVAVK
jgi:large subunit ribosomal protein L9